MRVAVQSEQLLYRSPGGIGRYTSQLLNGMDDLDGDHAVAFVARHPRVAVAEAFSAAGVHPSLAERAVILALPRRVLYETWLLGSGWPAARFPEGVDVVHAPSVAVPPRSSVPLVVTVHDVAPELFPETFPAAGRRFHRRAVVAVARRADLVIAVSEAAAADIAAHSRIGEDRIRVVPNGVAPLQLDDAQVRLELEALGLADQPYVLSVGSLEPRKGVGNLLAAMARLRRRVPGWPVQTVVVGYAGWLQGGAVSAEDRATLGDSLHELGAVSETVLWALYRGARLFAFPSLYEGFGLPVLEAMSQAVPVVASDIASLRELTSGSARLVEPGDADAWADAIWDLADGGGDADRMGHDGRRRAEAFPVGAMVESTRRVYAEASGR